MTNEKKETLENNDYALDCMNIFYKYIYIFIKMYQVSNSKYVQFIVCH